MRWLPIAPAARRTGTDVASNSRPGDRRKPGPPRLSPTRLNCYLECPRQYYFGYVRRLPRRARSYFSFGTSLHAALQDFHEQGGAETQPVETLLENLQTSWVDAGYQTPQEAAVRFDLGQELLTAYYQAAEERQAETLFVEKMLSLPLEGFVLSGRVDRVDRRPDGLLEVIDYKSGGYLPSVDELENDTAIGIYQLLVARKMEETPIIGAIYNLRANQSVSIVRDESQLKQVESRVQSHFQVLSRDTTFTPLPGPHCRYCDYASYCPAAER